MTWPQFVGTLSVFALAAGIAWLARLNTDLDNYCWPGSYVPDLDRLRRLSLRALTWIAIAAILHLIALAIVFIQAGD
jgi:hypothetical protein